MAVGIAPVPDLYWYPYQVMGTASIVNTTIRIFQLGITATALRGGFMKYGLLHQKASLHYYHAWSLGADATPPSPRDEKLTLRPTPAG